jgi:hypothetical protein
MPLFRCSRCECVEDTALSNYWSARLQQAATLCSACDPKIAKWHGEFAREPAEGWRSDERSILVWNKREVEDWLGQSIEGAAGASGHAVQGWRSRAPEISEA